MAQERLQKVLAHAGVSSRRSAETLISAGRVKVNGKVVTEMGTKVDANKDLIVVDGRPITSDNARQWLLLYKPPGVVTTLSDPQGRPTVKDYLDDVGGRVFPVGRLDFDAEGALLFTDDGDLANQLTHPRHQVPRVYLAKVKGQPTKASLEKLMVGVRLEDGPARATEATIYEQAEKNTWVKIVVTEGRHHLIKRLCAAIGHPVVRLFRPSQAGISVAGLRPGQLRPLTSEELARVRASADGKQVAQPALRLPARRHGHGVAADAAAAAAALPDPYRPPREFEDEVQQAAAADKPRKKGGGKRGGKSPRR